MKLAELKEKFKDDKFVLGDMVNEPLPDCPVCNGSGLFKSRTDKVNFYCMCVMIDLPDEDRLLMMDDAMLDIEETDAILHNIFADEASKKDE
jgi:hypothetical protein